MSQSTNQDPTDEALVSFRNPTPGSCLTKELLQELASLLVVKLGSITQKVEVPVSTDTNNLASLDAANAILVPAVVVYSDTKTVPAIGPYELVFSGWPSEIDGTVGFLEIVLYSTNPGVAAATGSGVTAVNIQPRYKVTERTATSITVVVLNMKSSDANGATVTFRLAQLPIPPTQS